MVPRQVYCIRLAGLLLVQQHQVPVQLAPTPRTWGCTHPRQHQDHTMAMAVMPIAGPGVGGPGLAAGGAVLLMTSPTCLICRTSWGPTCCLAGQTRPAASALGWKQLPDWAGPCRVPGLSLSSCSLGLLRVVHEITARGSRHRPSVGPSLLSVWQEAGGTTVGTPQVELQVLV